VGGPPCQGFSISGPRNPKDPRNSLYKGFVNAVRSLKPEAFILENVPNLVAMANGSIKEQIIKDFEDLGYTVKYKILLASDYGVPQNRKRVIFVGLRENTFKFPDPTVLESERVTCSEAISDLPDTSMEDGKALTTPPLSAYQQWARNESCDSIYNHVATNHEEKTIKTIALVPDGGNYKDLPKSLQKTRKVNIAWTRYNSAKPSLTIDTGHRHHFHYKHNRVPTVRESARLQSFPDSFIFYGTKTSQYKQVGNAVPPLLGKALGEQILQQI
jgi:DNA (cytosine-5)-methyltransferase 1